MLKKLSTVILCSCALLVNASVLAKPMATETPGIANGTGSTWIDSSTKSCKGITLPSTIGPYSNFSDNPIVVDESKWDNQVCNVAYYTTESGDGRLPVFISIIPDHPGWHVKGDGQFAHAMGKSIAIYFPQ